MGPTWAGFSKCLILEHFVFFLSFLVLNAENQEGDTINLLDQHEKRNHTLWIKLESHSCVSESNRDHYNSHKGLNTVNNVLSKISKDDYCGVLVCIYNVGKWDCLWDSVLEVFLKCLYWDVKIVEICWLIGIS